MAEGKPVRFEVRFPDDVHALATQLANKQRRSLNSYLICLVEEAARIETEKRLSAVA